MNLIKNFYLLIFLTPLIINPFGYDAFELAKQSWIIAIIGITLLLTTLTLSHKKHLKLHHSKNINIYLGFLILSYLLSSLFSIAPLESIHGNYSRLQGLLIHLFYLLHFLICLRLITPQYFKKTLQFILLTSIPLSLYAITQKLNLDPLQQNALGFFSGRSSSFLGQPNFLGQILLFPLLISIHNLLNKKNKLLSSTTLLLNLTALHFSYNRASILALFIGVYLLLLQHKPLKKFRPYLITLGIITTSFIIYLLFQNNLRSLGSRYYLWQSALDAFTQNPLIGTGPETIYQTLQTTLKPEIYQFENLFTTPDRTHSQSLDILITRGLFGLTLHLISIIYLIKTFFKKLPKHFQLTQTIILTYLIALQFNFALSSHTTYLLFFWAALLKHQNPTIQTKINWTKPKKIIITIISASFIYLSSHLLFTDIKFKNAFDTYIWENNNSKALTLFQQTQTQNPLQQEYLYTPLFFLDQTPENKTTIQKFLQTHQHLTNQSFKHLIIRNKHTNTSEEKIQNLKQAEKKAPHYPFIHFELANIYHQKNNRNNTIKYYEKLINPIQNFPNWSSEQQRLFKKNNPDIIISIKHLIILYQLTQQKEKAQAFEAWNLFTEQ